MLGTRRNFVVLAGITLAIAIGIFVYFQRPQADSWFDFEGRLQSARLTFERQSFEEAATAYQSLVTGLNNVSFESEEQKQAAYEEAYSYWALSLLNAKNYDAAASVSQEYLRVVSSPTADFLVIYGNILRLRGDMESGIAQYQRALIRTPKHIVASINLADAYLEQGKLDEAKMTAEQALSDARQQAPVWPADADPMFFWLLASIYEQSGEADKANEMRATAARLEGLDRPATDIIYSGEYQ